MDEGRFRTGPYFRLSEITVTLPTRHFLDEAACRYRKPLRGLAPETESLLRPCL